jgi:hypothetical protein
MGLDSTNVLLLIESDKLTKVGNSPKNRQGVSGMKILLAGATGVIGRLLLPMLVRASCYPSTDLAGWPNQPCG